MKDVYESNGYVNRTAYLKALCEEYPREMVYALAEMLGPNEDFDGLVTELEDYADMGSDSYMGDIQ